MAAKESKGLILSAVALAVFAGAMFWALQGPSGPTTKPAAKPANEGPSAPPSVAASSPPVPSAPSAPSAPEEPSAAIEPAVDLFAGEMPDFMANSHARVLDKKSLSAPDQKRLYEYGKENPQDARPQLLLAWDSMNREWDGIAVRMYRIAYRADPRAKQDPSMLRDLLEVASKFDRVEYREATEIVREAFGAEALPALDDKIAELRSLGENKRIERLERLRGAVGGN